PLEFWEYTRGRTESDRRARGNRRGLAIWHDFSGWELRGWRGFQTEKRREQLWCSPPIFNQSNQRRRRTLWAQEWSDEGQRRGLIRHYFLRWGLYFGNDLRARRSSVYRHSAPKQHQQRWNQCVVRCRG